MGADRFEQVERSRRIDAEVGVGLAGRPVVRGLCGRVDDQLEIGRVLGDDPIDLVARANVRFIQRKASFSSVRICAVRFVEASGPKKRAGMSLSIPRTSKPSAVRLRTAEDPTNPLDPVTMATGIATAALPLRSRS